MRKLGQIRTEQVLVSNSSLVSGLSEASGVRFSWAEVSQESVKATNFLETFSRSDSQGPENLGRRRVLEVRENERK